MVTLAVICVLAVCGIAASSYSQGYWAAEEVAGLQTYSSRDAELIETQCAGLIGTEQIECIADVIASNNEDERSQADLTAQRSMALWALWMLAISAFSAFASAYGVYLVWHTLSATREGVAVTQRLGVAQSRAYLYVSGVELFEREHYGIGAKVQIHNSGTTPARGIHLLCRIDLFPSMGEPPINSVQVTYDLGGDKGRSLEFKIAAGMGFEDFETYRVLDEVLEFRGTLAYRDIFGQPQKVNFRYVAASNSFNHGELLQLEARGNSST